MRIDIITIFPKMFGAALNESIIKRAQEKKKVEIYIHNLRDYSQDKHKKVDDYPFGGGAGMVLCPQPIFKAVEHIKLKVRSKHLPKASVNLTKAPEACQIQKVTLAKGQCEFDKSAGGMPNSKVILLCPQGETLTQAKAKKLSRCRHLILICGHYEGIDERVREYLVDQEVSIGDYILTGGELPAMVLVDSVVRLLPGVLGSKNSLKKESFEGNLLEYPQYTRPADFKGKLVPKVLTSGNHLAIETWRSTQAKMRTSERRPDLLSKEKTREEKLVWKKSN